jgi:hypothetical protein
MFQFSTLLLALSVAGSVTAAPTHVNKRIAQVISDSTPKWEAACVSCTKALVNMMSLILCH